MNRTNLIALSVLMVMGSAFGMEPKKNEAGYTPEQFKFFRERQAGNNQTAKTKITKNKKETVDNKKVENGNYSTDDFNFFRNRQAAKVKTESFFTRYARGLKYAAVGLVGAALCGLTYKFAPEFSGKVVDVLINNRFTNAFTSAFTSAIMACFASKAVDQVTTDGNTTDKSDNTTNEPGNQ